MTRAALPVVIYLVAMPPGCSDHTKAVSESREARAMEIEAKKLNTAPGDMERVPPEVVYDRVVSGDALLVCAYKSDIAYWAAELFGSVPFNEFEQMVPTLPKDREIYFYCA